MDFLWDHPEIVEISQKFQLLFYLINLMMLIEIFNQNLNNFFNVTIFNFNNKICYVKYIENGKYFWK